MSKILRVLLRLIFLGALFIVCTSVGINVYMAISAKSTAPEIQDILAKPENASPPLSSAMHAHLYRDYALVLGASVRGNILSDALKARMNVAIALYQKGLVGKIFMSGSGTNPFYNETRAMRGYALAHGVPPADVLMDDEGYNTYTSMFRARHLFDVKWAYIITQNFHMVRAVWIARHVGIQADGANAGSVQNDFYYSTREFFARIKDFFQTWGRGDA